MKKIFVTTLTSALLFLGLINATYACCYLSVVSSSCKGKCTALTQKGETATINLGNKVAKTLKPGDQFVGNEGKQLEVTAVEHSKDGNFTHIHDKEVKK